MKQAHRWLLFVAAMLIASPAVAQKKPGGGQKPQPPAAGAAAGGSTEIELDEPAKPAEPAPTDATPSTGGGGICEIDPSACPKELDVNAAAKKDVNAERYAVQQIYAYRARRFEIQPYWAFTLNDQFVSHPGPGLALNYYITHALAVGINGNLYAGLNGDSDFNFQNRRATRVAVPLNEYAWSAGLNFTYVPIYGKFAGFGNFIFHYDMYVVGGVGAISTRPIPVIDPDNRKFEYAPKLSIVNPGIGLRVFINRWFSANLEVRDYIYNETLESLTVGTTQAAQQDPKTWTGENRLTNHVQAQVGISVFLPFSWDYRLPK